MPGDPSDGARPERGIGCAIGAQVDRRQPREHVARQRADQRQRGQRAGHVRDAHRVSRRAEELVPQVGRPRRLTDREHPPLGERAPPCPCAAPGSAELDRLRAARCRDRGDVRGLPLQLELAERGDVADPDRRATSLPLALARPIRDRHPPAVANVDLPARLARLREQNARGHRLEPHLGRRAIGFEELEAHDRNLSPSGS
jgi:hypothetical protein